MKSGGKNTSVVFIILFSVYVNIYIYTRSVALALVFLAEFSLWRNLIEKSWYRIKQCNL